MHQSHLTRPQVTTGPRLLRLGEAIQFEFFLPSGAAHGRLQVFERYLESQPVDGQWTSRGGLRWLNPQSPLEFDLNFRSGRASLEYRPTRPGNYLARWSAGDETFHRYFAVIEDDFVVLRFSSFIELESEPTLHATGIPLDYRLPVDQFEPGNKVFDKLLSYHRHFGDAVTPELPDTPPTGETAGMNNDDRVQQYAVGLDRARSLLPDASDARSGRLQFKHHEDPGYVEVFRCLGLSDHFGLQEPNILPWLGMPEFPYFASPLDLRKPNQQPGGEVISHTWDFCAGFHFLGPVTWHYAASEGDFAKARECLVNGMDELRNMAELSGYPAFANPLYDGATINYGYPNGSFNEGYGAEKVLTFVDAWQRTMAFEFTKTYRLAFARSIDISDYYRRHFSATQRTVFSTKTEHPLYDVWWNCVWGREYSLTMRERIPWMTRISTLMKQRKSGATVNYVNLVTGAEVTAPAITKDPISSETLLIEDQHRSIRFERESPNPIWWFDYTRQERGHHGSVISHTETPDVDVIRSAWSTAGSERTVRLRMITDAHFDGYAVALWGVPARYSPDRTRINTNARDFILAKNRDDEFHIVLFFDLQPDAEVFVTVSD